MQSAQPMRVRSARLVRRPCSISFVCAVPLCLKSSQCAIDPTNALRRIAISIWRRKYTPASMAAVLAMGVLLAIAVYRRSAVCWGRFCLDMGRLDRAEQECEGRYSRSRSTETRLDRLEPSSLSLVSTAQGHQRRRPSVDRAASERPPRKIGAGSWRAEKGSPLWC